MRAPPLRRSAAALLLAAVVTALVAMAAAPGAGQQRAVVVTEVGGPITPVVAAHLADVVDTAAAEEREAVVIRLDTPGGLVTSMREIVQKLLGAPLPVIVYVSPSGADAASAGTFVTMAAHVAAMAPATTIGAATPVDLTDGEARAVGEKIVNNTAAYARTIAEFHGRSVEFAVDAVREGRAAGADEAEEIGAVDLVAEDLGSLLERIDGRTVTVAGDEVVLQTADAATVSEDMTWTRRLQQSLADPNLAFLFMSLGTLGIVYEVASPGMGAGGILGTVMLILALLSMSVLPINLAGVALMVLAGVLFVIELFVPGVGVAAGGGSVALVLAGLLLIDEPSGLGLDWWVVLPSGLLLFGLVLGAGRLVATTRTAPSHVASDALVGRTASVHDVDGPRGRVRLDGTWWRALHARDEALAEGQSVTVVGRRNLDLVVDPDPDDTDTPPTPA